MAKPSALPIIGNDEKVGLRRARKRLRALIDEPVTALGLFAVPDPGAFQNMVAMLAGGAALGAMSSAAGEAVDTIIRLAGSGPRLPDGMPRHVLVVVTPKTVTLLAHSHHSAPGKQAASFEAGHFKAHTSRYPFNIDLTISPEKGQRLVLSGKRGPRHGAVRTARAALDLSEGSDKPAVGNRFRR